MSRLDARWRRSVSRRRALAALAGFAAGATIAGRRAAAQADPRPFAEHKRLPGLDEMVTAFDFEPIMFANVPMRVYDFTAHGDGSEFTLRRNRQAFGWVDLVAGRAIDPAAVDLSTSLFGTNLKYPIIVAPTATQAPLHPDGEVGMYKAATAASNTLMVLSQVSSVGVDKVAPVATGPLWCQFYPQQDRAGGRRILDSYQSAGCKAIVVTVDQQASNYERTLHDQNLGGTARPTFRGRSGPATEGPGRYRASVGRLWYSWSYLDEIRRVVQVPLLVKGILTAEDARLCVEHGIDGIIVSNHGGRSMDYGPSTLEALPEIVAEVGDRVPVITDSGYRRGEDILKALALGARAVMLGRPTRWALGAFGSAGVQRLLEIVQQELVAATARAGCPTRAAIDRRIVRTSFS